MTLKTSSMISILGFAVLLLLLFSVPQSSLAGPYVGVIDPVLPLPGDIIPPPERVPGKEFSDEFDRNAAGGFDDGQVIAWDGVIPPAAPGGGVDDTFDYDGIEAELFEFQVDALANKQDVLFFEVINNQAAALFSERLQTLVGGVDTTDPIYYESTGGARGTWATAPQVSQHDVQNLDGLEVWGADWPGDDADRFSLVGDSLSGVSVYSYIGGGYIPYITTAELAIAVGIEVQFIDVDATMVFDVQGNNEWEIGDWLIFSLWANTPAGILGDEVWVWQKGTQPFYLDHGGHLWDSGWNRGIEIDALEAVATIPEPATMLLFGFGLLGLAGIGRRKA